MYVCRYVGMYACMHVRKYVYLYVCMCVCKYADGLCPGNPRIKPWTCQKKGLHPRTSYFIFLADSDRIYLGEPIRIPRRKSLVCVLNQAPASERTCTVNQVLVESLRE